MEYLWVILALVGAAIQTSRNGLMKHLKRRLDDEAIMFSRFAFSVPFVLLFLGLCVAIGYDLPKINADFVQYFVLAAICQIAGGYLFLKILGRRNFVIGVTYTRTDSMMKVLFAALLFGEMVSAGALFAIILSFFGILLITIVEQHLEPKNLIKRIFTPSAIMGVSSGVCFGLTGVLIRQAIIALDGEFFVRSAYTLLFIIMLQALIFFVILLIKKKEQLAAVVKSGASPYILGCINAASALCWFVAFSLTHAAYVSMVGQVEILFSIFLTHKVFKEKIVPLEILGMTIVVGSIFLLVYFQ